MDSAQRSGFIPDQSWCKQVFWTELKRYVDILYIFQSHDTLNLFQK